MITPSREMMNALAEWAFTELAALPESEVNRLLKGILGIVSAELNRQSEIDSESAAVLEAALVESRQRWSAWLRCQAGHKN